MNEVIQVSLLQYQTATQYFFEYQIFTASFQNNNLKYYLLTLF